MSLEVAKTVKAQLLHHRYHLGIHNRVNRRAHVPKFDTVKSPEMPLYSNSSRFKNGRLIGLPALAVALGLGLTRRMPPFGRQSSPIMRRRSQRRHNKCLRINTQATGFTAATNGEQMGIAARLAGTPLRGFDWLIHVGVNYTGVINPADAGATAAVRYAVQLRDRPELRVDGTRLIDTGALNAQGASATGFELAGQYKSAFIQGEAFTYNVRRYAPVSGVTNPTFKGWYVEGGWSITGEAQKYNTQTAAFDAVTARASFDPKAGNWGAFELVARYSTIDLNYHQTAALTADRVLGGQQDITSLGLDWQLNTAVRFVFEGQSVQVDRLNATGLQVGQDYSAFAVRSQFNA